MAGRGNAFLDNFGPDVALVTPYLRPVSLAAGEVICEAGERIRHVYFLSSGAVSKLTPFEDGSEIECALVGRKGAVGAMSALGLKTAVTRDVCHLPCEALRLPVERLAEATARSQRIHDVLDHYCAWLMAAAVRNGACNARHAVDQRLGRWLLQCADALQEDEIALSQDVFAKMLGVQRSSVSPILQKLRREGLVALERSRLRVLDRAGLLARSCECYAAMKSTERQWVNYSQSYDQNTGALRRIGRG
jgi:CRP-like cAMP-binding protein